MIVALYPGRTMHKQDWHEKNAVSGTLNTLDRRVPNQIWQGHLEQFPSMKHFMPVPGLSASYAGPGSFEEATLEGKDNSVLNAEKRKLSDAHASC